MFCMHCGKKIEDDNMFCPFCGASTKEESSSATDEPQESNATAGDSHETDIAASETQEAGTTTSKPQETDTTTSEPQETDATTSETQEAGTTTSEPQVADTATTELHNTQESEQTTDSEAKSAPAVSTKSIVGLIVAAVLFVSLIAAGIFFATGSQLPFGQSADSEIATEDSGNSTSAGNASDNTASAGTAHFNAFADKTYVLTSGAGAWETSITLNEDGTFTGSFHDTNMGETGEDYPNGTTYYCEFTGSFGKLTKIDTYTYSAQLTSLDYTSKDTGDYTEDGMRFIASEPYGLTDGHEFKFFITNTPIDDLPKDYRVWIEALWLSNNDSLLPGCGFFNVDEGLGFFCPEDTTTSSTTTM